MISTTEELIDRGSAKIGPIIYPPDGPTTPDQERRVRSIFARSASILAAGTSLITASLSLFCGGWKVFQQESEESRMFYTLLGAGFAFVSVGSTIFTYQLLCALERLHGNEQPENPV